MPVGKRSDLGWAKVTDLVRETIETGCHVSAVHRFVLEPIDSSIVEQIDIRRQYGLCERQHGEIRISVPECHFRNQLQRSPLRDLAEYILERAVHEQLADECR